MELTSSASNSLCVIKKQPCSTTALPTLTHKGTTVKTRTAASMLFLTFFADMAPSRPLDMFASQTKLESAKMGGKKLTAYRQCDEDK